MRGNIFDIFYQLSMLSIVIPKERVLKKVGLRYNYSIGLGVCRMNKKIIDKYTKEYGVRFSRRQKRKASLVLFEDMKDAGYEGTMISGRKVFSKAENYLFGNIKTMKTVIVIPFDTPQHCFWRRVSYYPLNGNKSANKSVLPMFAPVILLYLMVFVMLWIADHFVTSPQLAFGISLFIYFLIFFLLYLMTIGIANRNNYNRYSLSVATAIELAQKLGKDEITVLAAASMKDALEEIKTMYPNENIVINYSYGASGTLQNQIEQGAPADIFISAADKQMDTLEEKGKIDADTRGVLLKNDLVLIAGKNNTAIKSIDDLEKDSVKAIAVGEFASVPAGQYAKEALDSLRMFDTLKDKIVYGSDVRAVLNWVETSQADCGIVYGSDAKSSDLVRVVDSFPNDSHKEIRYPIAIIKDSKHKEAAKEFMEYLQSDDAKNVFKDNGFQVE